MKTSWLYRERVKRVRVTKDQEIVEALRRVELAIGEIAITERREKGVVTHRRVRNRDAIARARLAYQRAATLIGEVRVADGTATGARSVERSTVRDAMTRLDRLRGQIEEIEAIPR